MARRRYSTSYCSINFIICSATGSASSTYLTNWSWLHFEHIPSPRMAIFAEGQYYLTSPRAWATKFLEVSAKYSANLWGTLCSRSVKLLPDSSTGPIESTTVWAATLSSCSSFLWFSVPSVYKTRKTWTPRRPKREIHNKNSIGSYLNSSESLPSASWPSTPVQLYPSSGQHSSPQAERSYGDPLPSPLVSETSNMSNWPVAAIIHHQCNTLI